MRRGVEDGSRACLELGPRLVEAGAAALTLHPRSAKQMYTGYADHTLTAELVELVDVPVDRVRRRHVAGEGAGGARRDRRERGDGRPRRAGQPVGDARDRRSATRAQPSREEVAAELILFIRETVRELGERRASGFLKKFYALVPRPRPLPEAVQERARAAAVDRRGR